MSPFQLRLSQMLSFFLVVSNFFGTKYSDLQKTDIWHVPPKEEGVCVKTVTVGEGVPERGRALTMHLSTMWASVPSYQKHFVLNFTVLAHLYYNHFARCRKSVRIFFITTISCIRTLGRDTWHDKFTPPLGMIKLLTLCGPSNHPPSPTGRQSENHSVWEACLQPCNLTDASWLWKKWALCYIIFWYTMFGWWWWDSVKLCCATVLGGFGFLP